MYLKQIEIRGFKSFADKTVLKLFPGMTAVVGPNGCGKSNIVDAIRWVLGEQSAKALRGSLMQDVIFEGTEKRKALPTAEVILTFTDCEEELGTAFNEVEISRRVNRDGGSDYYLNGKIVRLKDIQRLFANTGVGRVSYSFMLQGQIDQILSTNASERRTIFEEAAGITLYKSQRKEALNKLALVDTNLNRVTDVIEEVGRQINSLKRQASKALRYRRLEHRVKYLDLAVSAKRFSEFDSSIQGSLGRTKVLSEKVKALSEALNIKESDLLSKKQKQQALSEAIQLQQQRVYELRSEKENILNQSEIFSVRTTDSHALIESHKKEICQLEEELSIIINQAKVEAESKQEQLNLMGDSDLMHQNQENEFAQYQARLNHLEESLQTSRNESVEIEGTINRMRSEATSLELEIKTYQVKHGDLTEKLVTCKQELTVFEDIYSSLQLNQNEASVKLSNLESKLEVARTNETIKLNQFKELQESYQEADRSIAKKTAQLHVLQNLQAKFEGFAEGAKSILGGKLNELANENTVSIISKAIRVPQTNTVALQTLLGMAVDALYVGDPKKSFTIINALNEKKLGRVCLQIDAGLPSAANAIDLPDGIKSVNSVISITQDSLKPTLNQYFDGCYFSDSLERFINFWFDNPDFKFTFVATEKGELVDCRGLVYGGSEQGEKATGVLERASDLRYLELSISEDRKKLNAIHKAFETVQNERNKAATEVDLLREDLVQSTQEIASLNSDVRAQKEKINNLIELRKKTEIDRENLEQLHKDLLGKAEKSKFDLAEAESNYLNLRGESKDKEKEIGDIREALEKQRDKLAHVRLDLAQKRQRLVSADENMKRVESDKLSL